MSTKYTCCASIQSNYSYDVCGLTAKVERDGKHYCGIHDPVTRKAKDDKRYAERRVKYDAANAATEKALAEKKEIERRAECYPDLLAALQGFVSHGTCFDELDLAVAKSAIAKATGELV